MELLARIYAFARSSPDRIAYASPDGRRVTYGALAERIRVVRSLLSIDAGETIVLHSCNTPTFAAIFLGAISAGRAVLLLNDSTPLVEQQAFVQRVGAKTILSPSSTLFDAEDGVCFADEIRDEHAAAESAPAFIGDLLLASSGSTGLPKIVRRDAASLDAVAANMVESIGFKPEDCVLAAVPLSHSYGIEHGLLAPLWAGSSVALFDGFDLDAINATTMPLTIFPAVPAMLERLADAGSAVGALANLRTIYSAGAALPESVRERFIARYGRSVGQLFGSTEVGTVTYRAGDARPGNDVGWPMRGVSIRTLDSGEVALRSPSMFRGYVDDHEDTPFIDGHFLTGDLGHLSGDGALVLDGRSKLLINVGGLKVNPAEVEAALCAHADVAECVVVPLPQSETMSRLRAIIVPREDASVSAATIRAHARRLLASYKVPRVFEFRATPLPRSATGKLLRTKIDDP